MSRRRPQSPDPLREGLSRRTFLSQVAVGAAASALPAACATGELAQPTAAKGGPLRKRHNIVFVFTDQERYFRKWPNGLVLPGHERLARTGTTFVNHYCPAVMCTSSRAVLMTGLQTADNRMFENADARWVKALSTDVPTVGHMLRKAGYYTAYKGKWHLNKDFENSNPDRLFTSEMDAYGFSDYAWPGDLLAHELGGFRYDHMIAGSAVSWLRNRACALRERNQPWALFVSLVNPHDIMYFNTDEPGANVQDTGQLMMHATHAPSHPDYRQSWDLPVPDSLQQAFDEPGRPQAHREYDLAWGYTLGRIPPEQGRWRRFLDYYVNCIRAVDAQLATLLAELDSLSFAEDTIVMFTSDHGEMGGAHGLRGKGAFAYEESLHLPFYVVHPDVRGGEQCKALTSHLDVAPTLLAMAGLDRARMGEAAGRDLPGVDISPALSSPRSAATNAVREQILFTYSGLAQNDSGLMKVLAQAAHEGKEQMAALKESGFKPDLRKRGSLRATFDGRYKFARYFSPLQRNRPTDVDELYRHNDVELYDLQQDPAEMHNLGARQGQNDEVVAAMNGKLNAAIDAEFGKDDGREMPAMEGVTWSIERVEL